MILTCCLYIFVAGWPGCVHDNRVLNNAIEDPNKASPYPPKGILSLCMYNCEY